MAYTKTDFTLTAGFAPADVLTKLGEALAAMGIMSNATDWYDSFTDTSGSEVRIVRMVYNADTYGTAYHAFMTKSTFDGLWYTMYYNWNNTTHESEGAANYDMVKNYEHPDDLAPTSWSSYYTQIDAMNNASDIIFSAFSENNEIPVLFVNTSGTPRLVGFVPTTQQPTTGLFDHTSLGPLSMLAFSVTANEGAHVVPTCLLHRMIGGVLHSDGTTSGDWATSALLTGLALGGGVIESRLTGIWSAYGGGATPWGIATQGAYYNPTVTSAEAYTGVLDHPLAVNIYPDLGLGPSFMFMQGWNDSAWTPSVTDTLVISAGTEEYLVTACTGTLSSNYSVWGANWYALCLRTV